MGPEVIENVLDVSGDNLWVEFLIIVVEDQVDGFLKRLKCRERLCWEGWLLLAHERDRNKEVVSRGDLIFGMIKSFYYKVYLL